MLYHFGRKMYFLFYILAVRIKIYLPILLSKIIKYLHVYARPFKIFIRTEHIICLICLNQYSFYFKTYVLSLLNY